MQNPIIKSITNKISYTSIFFSLVVLLSGGYVVCVYKMVNVASDHEKTKSLFTELQARVSEKEHIYIQKTGDISMDEALALGYQKNNGGVAYINTSKDIALAVR